MPLPLIPLVFAGVALTGLIVSLVLFNKILAHFDNTKASEDYSAAVLDRAKEIERLHAQGMSVKEAERIVGPPPARPKAAGFGWGLPATLIGLGAAAVGVAFFWPTISRLLFHRRAA